MQKQMDHEGKSSKGLRLDRWSDIIEKRTETIIIPLTTTNIPSNVRYISVFSIIFITSHLMFSEPDTKLLHA